MTGTDEPRPYKVTAIWDEETLPAAIRGEHSTKAGVWGLLRVFEGEVRLIFGDARDCVVSPAAPGLIPPQAVHHVEFDRPFRMQVEFYRERPV